MSEKLIQGCFRNKMAVNNFGSSEPLSGRIDTISEPRSLPEKSCCSFRVHRLFVAMSFLVLLAALVGGVQLSITLFSKFKQMQRRVELLERRLELLEKEDQKNSNYEYDGEDISTVLVSPVQSNVEETRDLLGSADPLGRKKRNTRKNSRDKTRQKALASIHMEMVSGSSRRKRSESIQRNILDLKMAAENSNHILWRVSDWVPQQSRDNFRVGDSELAEIGVKNKGLYFIYAQIVFRNLGTNNIVSIKSKDREFTRCYDGVDYAGEESEKLKTCYTGTVAMIRANETITVHNLYGHEIHNESVSNFFGLIKLADLR